MGNVKAIDILVTELVVMDEGYHDLPTSHKEQYREDLGLHLIALHAAGELTITSGLVDSMNAGCWTGNTAPFHPSTTAEFVVWSFVQGWWAGYGVDQSGIPGSGYTNQG